MHKRYLTTGEAASYCGVTLRTIINWIKRGELKAHQLPGQRGDNRISCEDLVRFLTHNKMPIPEELLPDEPLPDQPLSEERPKSVSAPVTVLVVDDDTAMANAIRRTLRQAGFTVHIANNGFEAGRQYEKIKPALMTLDLQMPKLNGFELLEQLIQRRRTKILVISAMGEQHLKRAMSLSADDTLAKPFENDILIAKVNKLLTPGAR